ncbi:MAG: hypothetical protein OXI41_02450 [Chloroflexota bacterium]|nr:hypothetical protein [Chloroflexota bacterium]MDE2896012.1 hypothetical protein [Chloroflexota bacterium]
MTLSRRQFVKRSGWLAGGAVAAALVGCAEDEQVDRPQLPPTQTAEQPGPNPQPVQPQTQQQIAPQRERPDPDSAEQVEQASETHSSVQQAGVEQPAAQAQKQERASPQPARREPPAERRLLVPDVVRGDHELQDPAFEPISGARVDFGEIDGGGYRIELPEEWNGELVLWAHGFRGLDDEGTGISRRLTFDDIPARDVIIGQGFGWATSTYRVNGCVPGVGVDDLLRVKDRFAELARPPRRTYIAGGSMGGATAQLMAQEFPEEIAAALAFCPAMGNVWVVDYTVAWHALAHWLIGEPPEQMDVDGMLEWAEALGTADVSRLSLSPLGEQFAALIEDFTGGERWGFADGLRQQWDIAFGLGVTIWPDIVAAGPSDLGAVIPVSRELPPADTREHIYSADPAAGIDLQRLNEEVIRFASDSDRRHDPGVGIPTGTLRVPLLAMKTTGDLFTPIHLDRDYQVMLQESGWDSNLVVQTVRRAGHCTFSEREALSAFTRIVSWLSFGLAPAGDDLQGDLSLVGTRFTDPFDEDDPLRPGA